MTDEHRGRRWLRWPAGTDARRIAYGGDYDPEQWPREVWREDVRLMREAGVNIVTVAVFSWARLQPRPDTWDFAWLDEVMDLLHGAGIAVDLATATASPPPWLTTRHPEILPVTATGETLWPGGRQHWRPTSPVFRRYALALVEAMARRYGDHPALAVWHVSNELGCHNAYDYSDDAAAAFRTWLRARYGSLDALNDAWGTAFWSQYYGDWAEVLPPRQAAAFPNPTQQLDFLRFSSDALEDHLRAERDLLHRLTPDVPVTTNFMVMARSRAMDYADWAAEVDLVANDHYVVHGPQERDELSFSANLTGHLAGGRPWFLMEHSTSAVNWQPVNLPKLPGALARDSLTHVAHGADAVCFFQWRQSRAGAEKFHSAMLPNAGPDTAVFRRVVELGRTFEALAGVVGSVRLPARVAVCVDWESRWAAELDARPSARLRQLAEALDWYSALLDRGVRADVVPVGAPLAGYDVVVAPMLYLVPRPLAERLGDYVAAGGHLVVTYFSGIVDEHDHLWPGPFPGALRDLLGIRIEELGPVPDDEVVPLDLGVIGTLWADPIEVIEPDVEVLARYAAGERAGGPAVTRRVAGAGSATYVGIRLGAAGLAPVVAAVLDRAGVVSELPEGSGGRLELAIRTDGAHEHWFLVNRTEAPVTVDGLAGEVVVGGARDASGALGVPGRGVVVLRRPARGLPVGASPA